MYAITAITGRVGGALARTLIDRGHAVRAVVRDAAKGEAWAARGCAVAHADASDADALAAAFTDVAGAFLLLRPMFDPAPDFAEARGAIAAFREAVVRARPARLVVLSTIGADAERPNLLNALRFLEQGLAAVPVPVTFLRAAWFMENAEWDVAPARDEGVIRSCLQPLDRKVAMVSAGDVGRVAADLLLEDWQGERIVELEAAARVSPHDIAAAFARALGRPVRAEAVPREQWEAMFRAQGMRNPGPRMQMLDGFNQGWIDFTGANEDHRKGRTTIDEAIAALVRP
ncbi:NmrA family NAD(P)-binding protein [Sphingomonas quercus]|uniref:NmrA family NAD(P)-binding protein n=1 Tax=Sphingomonas quercus TaxID=2842451 RepID=A0ABS6BGP8_9SPHN|nr:NmrA family NAD(P)-binding protein [Sphingomonas quercus]MBU3076656.1 NmrA family NAD(P)-binding protein [Sphingomonas quercus]